MTKHEKIAVGSTLIIGLIGLILGLSINGSYFSRAGAVIVVIGIIYGLQELPKRLANVDFLVKEMIKDHKQDGIDKLLADDPDADRGLAEAAYKSASQITLMQANEHAEKMRKEIVLIEGIILISGTLIWGFGDIINPVMCITS